MKIQESIQRNTEDQVAVFGVLADGTRLRLVKLLCRQPEPDALYVNALARILGVSQSAVSQHLRILKGIGLVNGERRGYHIHYSLNREMLERYRKLISEVLIIREPDKE
jgi:ArsR family transcriptional regulator